MTSACCLKFPPFSWQVSRVGPCLSPLRMPAFTSNALSGAGLFAPLPTAGQVAFLRAFVTLWKMSHADPGMVLTWHAGMCSNRPHSCLGSILCESAPRG